MGLLLKPMCFFIFKGQESIREPDNIRISIVNPHLIILPELLALKFSLLVGDPVFLWFTIRPITPLVHLPFLLIRTMVGSEIHGI